MLHITISDRNSGRRNLCRLLAIFQLYIKDWIIMESVCAMQVFIVQYGEVLIVNMSICLITNLGK